MENFTKLKLENMGLTLELPIYKSSFGIDGWTGIVSHHIELEDICIYIEDDYGGEEIIVTAKGTAFVHVAADNSLSGAWAITHVDYIGLDLEKWKTDKYHPGWSLNPGSIRLAKEFKNTVINKILHLFNSGYCLGIEVGTQIEFLEN